MRSVLCSRDFPHVEDIGDNVRRFGRMALCAVEEANRLGIAGVELSDVVVVCTPDFVRAVDCVSIEALQTPKGVKGGAS